MIGVKQLPGFGCLREAAVLHLRMRSQVSGYEVLCRPSDQQSFELSKQGALQGEPEVS